MKKETNNMNFPQYIKHYNDFIDYYIEQDFDLGNLDELELVLYLDIEVIDVNKNIELIVSDIYQLIRYRKLHKIMQQEKNKRKYGNI